MNKDELKKKVSNFIEKYYDMMETFETEEEYVRGISIMTDETYQPRYEIVDIKRFPRRQFLFHHWD